MTQDELKMVLEALKWCHGGEPCGTAEAIAVVEKALAQPEQEPHGWYIDGYGAVIGTAEPKSVRVGEWLPWYTTPPQRTWVGLTDEEKSELWEISRAALPRYATYASLVEAKLKEKNT